MEASATVNDIFVSNIPNGDVREPLLRGLREAIGHLGEFTLKLKIAEDTNIRTKYGWIHFEDTALHLQALEILRELGPFIYQDQSRVLRFKINDHPPNALYKQLANDRIKEKVRLDEAELTVKQLRTALEANRKEAADLTVRLKEAEDVLASVTEAINQPAPPPQPIQAFICCVCLDSLPFEQLVALTECEHTLCLECNNRNKVTYRSSIAYGPNVPKNPPCPQCRVNSRGLHMYLNTE
jgi:hypothetical protein